jgi:TolB-like protein
VIFLAITLGSCITTKESNLALSLDAAIQESAFELTDNLNPGTIIAILNISSKSGILSEYIIEELSLHLPKNKNITVVDRNNLGLIQQEMDFQLSGEVSDESAQAIGKKLGAHAVVLGSLTEISGSYRLRVKIINVETAVIMSTASFDIRNNDMVITQLTTENSAETGKLKSTSTRYVAEDGLFTIDKPETWELVENLPSKYKPIRGHWWGNTALIMGIGFDVEENQLSLTEYTEVRINNFDLFFDDCFPDDPEPFITKNGLNGIRVIVSYTIRNTEIYCISVSYIFPGKNNTKITIVCSAFADMSTEEGFEAGDDLEDNLQEKLSYFDEIVRSFILLK